MLRSYLKSVFNTDIISSEMTLGSVYFVRENALLKYSISFLKTVFKVPHPASFHCLGRSHTMKSPSPFTPSFIHLSPQISHYYLLLIISQKELSPVIQLQWAATLIASLDGTMDCHQNEAKNIDLSIMIWRKA